MTHITIRTLSRIAAAAVGCAVPLLAQQRAPDDATPLNESERIHHVLSRFAFGPTPALVERVREIGLDAWLERQWSGAVPESQVLTQRLAKMPAIGMNGTELMQAFRDPPPAQRPKYTAPRQLKDAVLLHAIYGENQVVEAASDFFRNHFNIDVNKNSCEYLGPDWEREVIRAAALGDFPATLERTAKHPAMLIYLDNSVSRRPLSKGELRGVEVNTRTRTRSRKRGEEAAAIAKQRGLNENYARELLELHTLGVDRFYRQRDVVEVAKILTGWTVSLDTEAGVGFCFKPSLHCRGEKWFLGASIRASSANPMKEGEEVLARLARHKGTAEFLSWKLCRHFVTDDPPEDMVKRLAVVWRRTKGDMEQVLRALVTDQEFFAPHHYQAKFKRPFEFIVSALRITGAKVSETHALHRLLDELSEPIYECEDPTGYYDQAEAWRDPGVLAVRWRFAMDLAANRVPGVRVPKSFYKDLHPRIRRAWRDQLSRRILPGGMSPLTARVIDGRVKKYIENEPGATPLELGPLIVGLLIGSPEFQRQ